MSLRVASTKKGPNNISVPVYETLNFQICENVLYHRESKITKIVNQRTYLSWLVIIQISIVMSLVAVVVDICIETLTDLKYYAVSTVINVHGHDHDFITGVLVWLVLSIIPVALGSYLTTYLDPSSAGSGISDVKMFLNGVNTPSISRLTTLYLKMLGCVCTYLGELTGGKEGPLIHAGATVANNISNGKTFHIFKWKINYLTCFRDDAEKRDFVLGGVAAGVASAFSAPIGGLLFTMEEASSSWNLNQIYKIIVASVLGAFVSSTAQSLIETDTLAFEGAFQGIFNFGKLDKLGFYYYEIPVFALIGVGGGVMGHLFIFLNSKLHKFRQRFVKWNITKVIEMVSISTLTIITASIMIYYLEDCRSNSIHLMRNPIMVNCDDNEYDSVAELWFTKPENVVKSLLHNRIDAHTITSLSIYALVYYFLTIMTYGASMSLGTFIPSVLIGASAGRLFSMVWYSIWPQDFLDPAKYALLGAAAFMGGLQRMTFSATVILMESTGAVPSFAIPLIFTQMIAKYVGDRFGHGIYENTIISKNAPCFLIDPPTSPNVTIALHIMQYPVVCFRLKEKASHVYEILLNTTHNGFPIVGDVEGGNVSNGRLMGLILRYQLFVIFLNSYYAETAETWEDHVSLDDFRDLFPDYPGIDEFKLDPKFQNYTIDFTMFMNMAVITCHERDTIPCVFNQMRTLQLRHLIVTDKKNRVQGMITRQDFYRVNK